MKEIWLPIKDYEGLYEVSSLGKVRSLDRNLIVSNGKKYIRKGRTIKPHVNKFGYQRIGLSKNGIREQIFVHRIVAKAFLPTSNMESLDVNHIDGNKQNNTIQNLEWCNRQYNMQHAYRNGLVKFKVTAHPKRRIAKLDYNENILNVYNSIKEAAIDTGINASSISHVARGKYKHVGGFGWKYM